MEILNALLRTAFENGTLVIRETDKGKFALKAKIGGAYITLAKITVRSPEELGG